MASRKSGRRDSRMEEERTGCFLPHVLMVTVLLLTIVYISVILASRTDGFRSYVQDRLETEVGIPLRVERARVTAALSLILEQVSSKDGLTAGMPGIQAGRIVVDWNLSGFFNKAISVVGRLELNDVYFSLSANEQGQWEPASVADFACRMGTWLGAAIPMKDEPELGELGRVLVRTTLQIRNGRIVWWDREGELAHLTGIETECKPVTFRKREMVYRHISAESVFVRGQPRARNVQMEFIQTENRIISL